MNNLILGLSWRLLQILYAFGWKHGGCYEGNIRRMLGQALGKEGGGLLGLCKNFILQFEADRRAITITINSFETELSKDVREKLYPRYPWLYTRYWHIKIIPLRYGKLDPLGLGQLAKADDYEQVRMICDSYGVGSFTVVCTVLVYVNYVI